MKENIVEFPDRHTIEEEAVAWLIELDGDGAPSAEELEALREWLERSPAHRQELVDLAEFWDKLNVLTELAVPLGKCRTNVKPVFPSRSRAVPLAAAAVLVVLGATVAFVAATRPDPTLASNGLYATAVGQQQATVLADGSTVLLNTNSQIKVEYGKIFRDIRLLQGEAHFTVAADQEHPFRVYAGGGRVQAVGTAFSVYLKDDGVDVTVTEGSVELASLDSAGAPVILPETATTQENRGVVADRRYVQAPGTLKAGQSATIRSTGSGDASRAGSLNVVENDEIARRLSWRDGVLMFVGDPLETVVDEISRYTTTSIEIQDPEVRALRIGGRFPIGETEAMLDALGSNFGLHVTYISHDRVLLSAPRE